MASGDVADLMGMYDQMRSGSLGNGGGGFGRPTEAPDMGGQEQQQPVAGDRPDNGEVVEGPPAGSIPSKDQLDLVDIGNGVQVDRAVVPDLADILGHVDGLHVVEGHRDANQNLRSNGVPNSRHLVGKAVDLAGSAKAMRDGAGRARVLGVPEVALEGPHLHLGWS